MSRKRAKEGSGKGQGGRRKGRQMGGTAATVTCTNAPGTPKSKASPDYNPCEETAHVNDSKQMEYEEKNVKDIKKTTNVYVN